MPPMLGGLLADWTDPVIVLGFLLRLLTPALVTIVFPDNSPFLQMFFSFFASAFFSLRLLIS